MQAVQKGEDGALHGVAWTIGIGWKNTGRSPAVRVDIVVADRLVSPGEPLRPFAPPPSPGGRSGIIGPGGVGWAQERGIAVSDLDRVKRGQAEWLIYSRVTYGTTIDPAGERHTEICASVEYIGDRLEEGRTRPDLKLAPIGPQNTAT